MYKYLCNKATLSNWNRAASYIRQLCIKLTINIMTIIFPMFSWAGERVKDCYVSNPYGSVLHQTSGFLSKNLNVDCDGVNNPYLSKSAAVTGIRVQVVTKNKRGNTVIKNKEVYLKNPPGTIMEYLPNSINENFWVREQLQIRVKIKAGDEVRVLSHYIKQKYLIENLDNKELNKNFERPEASKAKWKYRCWYTKPPIILTGLGLQCATEIHPEKPTKAICYSDAVDCVASSRKIIQSTHEVFCFADKQGRCPSALECSNAVFVMKREVNIVFDKKIKRWRIPTFSEIL